MQLYNNMEWPPKSHLRNKMLEHSCWYSGDAELLANYYSNLLTEKSPMTVLQMQNDLFWSRQINQNGEIKIHVPIASDIAETSSNLLFSEDPIIKIKEYDKKDLNNAFKKDQELLDEMLEETSFFSRLSEGAEACSAIGGVYIKVAWDNELSVYPIPMIVQADMAIPTFKFGMLSDVTFWKVLNPISEMDSKANKVYRLLEKYSPGRIEYTLWLGNDDRLGTQIELTSHPVTEDMQPIVTTKTNRLLVEYIPNKLPNRLDRNSYLGSSDYNGIEGLMDSLDELFTNWNKEITAALGKLIVPESFLEGKDRKYNKDTTTYVQLNVDPVTAGGNLITPQQFAIRANEFEKTALNYIERIVSSAGYSPQSFGLNIQGRAESGTALNIRENKSSHSSNKKKKYWSKSIRNIVEGMIEIYNEELGGNFQDVSVVVEMPNAVNATLTETASAIKMIADASAASITTRVRLLHPDWEEKEIIEEVERIKEEMSIGAPNPDSLDIDQMKIDDNIEE